MHIGCASDDPQFGWVGFFTSGIGGISDYIIHRFKISSHIRRHWPELNALRQSSRDIQNKSKISYVLSNRQRSGNIAILLLTPARRLGARVNIYYYYIRKFFNLGGKGTSRTYISPSLAPFPLTRTTPASSRLSVSEVIEIGGTRIWQLANEDSAQLRRRSEYGQSK